MCVRVVDSECLHSAYLHDVSCYIYNLQNACIQVIAYCNTCRHGELIYLVHYNKYVLCAAIGCCEL